jgi:peptide-methionine (R)-S-oxide reductase
MNAHEQIGMSRRSFFVGGAAVLLGPRSVFALPADVEIIEFSDNGERLRVVKVPMIVKSDADWRKLLTEFEYEITRARGTEVAFSGAYWNLHDKGIFRCRCCDTALFSSRAKFDSGTGWPSFWQPIAEENVKHGKPSSGYTDSEVTCRSCDALLGDLFRDGPKPTGLRYCIDSISLKFLKSA